MSPRKVSPAAVAAAPISFGELKTRQTRERVHRYRTLLGRHAGGESLSESELSEVAELLEQLGLPDTAWITDLEGLHRYDLAVAKYNAAADAVPEYLERAKTLAVEVEQLRKKLSAVAEEQRIAAAKVGKPAAYQQTLEQLQRQHPTALASLDVATAKRLDVLNSRREAVLS